MFVDIQVTINGFGTAFSAENTMQAHHNNLYESGFKVKQINLKKITCCFSIK